jgi:hypothetical protein
MIAVIVLAGAWARTINMSGGIRPTNARVNHATTEAVPVATPNATVKATSQTAVKDTSAKEKDI